MASNLGGNAGASNPRLSGVGLCCVPRDTTQGRQGAATADNSQRPHRQRGPAVAPATRVTLKLVVQERVERFVLESGDAAVVSHDPFVARRLQTFEPK